MAKKKIYRDYTYQEWVSLSDTDQSDIEQNYWDPYEESVGLKTRQAILNAFTNAYPQLSSIAIAMGYKNVGWVGDMKAIYVIVKDSSIRIPKRFSSFHVDKGTVRKQYDKKTFLVDWRNFGGVKNKYIIKEGEIVQYLGYFGRSSE